MHLPKDGSPLSRGRGLKHQTTAANTRSCRVAPLAGAWIETRNSPRRARIAAVAPLAGAWIETNSIVTAALGECASPLSRGRGLKQRAWLAGVEADPVAPLAGAWIETTCDWFPDGWPPSPLSRGRVTRMSEKAIPSQWEIVRGLQSRVRVAMGTSSTVAAIWKIRCSRVISAAHYNGRDVIRRSCRANPKVRSPVRLSRTIQHGGAQITGNRMNLRPFAMPPREYGLRISQSSVARAPLHVPACL